MTTTDLDPQHAARPADFRLLALHDAIRSPGVKVVSTDVFDTLVWRQVPEPVDAFPLVAERLRTRGTLSDSLSNAAFAQLRRVAERRARIDRQARMQQSEVRLEEIYERLPAWVLASAPIEAAIEAELEVEHGLLVPDLDVVSLLAHAKAAGKTVVAVSDIYFSEPQLRRLLDQPVLGEVHFDRIFTSSDHRIGKSGGLFEIALRALGREPGEVVHVGDNFEADVHYPTELGIAAFGFERRPEPFATVSAAEAPFMPDASDSVAEGSLVSGLTATRSKVLARTEAGAQPDALRPFWNYGATVLGPVFTGYAEWVHEHCRRREVTRVGCLMREGAFLTELLERANPYLDAELEAVPLWLNRDLCLRASVTQGTREELERLLVRRSAPTVQGLCTMLGVPLSSLPEWTSHAGTSLQDPVVRHNLIEALSGDERVRAAIVQRSRELRERVVAYVDDFCGGPEGDVVVADLGWGASIQSLLSEGLAKAGVPRRTVGLYLVTHEGAAEQVVTGIEAHGFLGEYGMPGVAVDAVVRSPELLEQICMPPFGSQVGLGAELEPELGPNGLPRLQLVEAEAVRRGILAYQREWSRYHTAMPGKLGRLDRAQRLLRPILVRSVTAPTAHEVATFASWRHDEGQGSDRTDPIVDPEQVERLRYMDPDQLRGLPMSDVYWPFASAALVDEHWPDLIRAAASGSVSWDAMGSELETGPFIVHGRGVDVPESSRTQVVPKRNRFGLSAVTATVRAPFVQELILRPSTHAVVLRIDRIDVRAFAQGQEEPIERSFGPGEIASAFAVQDCSTLGANLFLSYEGTAAFVFPLSRLTQSVVFRVDVECAFSALPIAPVVHSGGRFRDLQHATAALGALEDSISWRITAPLRAAKRRLR